MVEVHHLWSIGGPTPWVSSIVVNISQCTNDDVWINIVVLISVRFKFFVVIIEDADKFIVAVSTTIFVRVAQGLCFLVLSST